MIIQKICSNKFKTITVHKMNVARCLSFPKGAYTHSRTTFITRNISLTTSNNHTVTSPKVNVDGTKHRCDDPSHNHSITKDKEKIKQKPFMKNVFVGDFNKNIFIYPEVLNKHDLSHLNAKLNLLKAAVSEDNLTAEQKIDILTELKVLGSPATADFINSLSVTERIRYVETLSYNSYMCQHICDHWVSLQALYIGFPSKRNSNFLNDISAGNPIALTLKERISENISEPDLRTKAYKDSNGVWRATGEKMCQRPSEGHAVTLCHVGDGQMRAFLVETNAEGCQMLENTIVLNNTPVTPFEDEQNSDTISGQAINEALNYNRLDTSVIAYSVLRRIIFKVVSYVRDKYVEGKPLAEMPLVRSSISQAVQTYYKAESMAYLTSGIMDTFEDPDTHLEMSMCRVYATEQTFRAVCDLLPIIEHDVSFGKEWTAYMDRVRSLLYDHECNDSIDIIIALTGLQHAGKELAQLIRKDRNPLYHPGFVFKKMFQDRHQESDEPKLRLGLGDSLPARLRPAAKRLEYCVMRLHYATETMLSRHGAHVARAHCELERMAKIATEIYAMVACISRAARANSTDIELRLADLAAVEGSRKVKALALEVIDGEFTNEDVMRMDFGKRLLNGGSLPYEKATERVFW